MSDNQVEELLVHWELTRQQGRELLASDLCEHAPHLEELIAPQIAVLKKTSWMLDDPATESPDTKLLSFLSRTIQNTKPTVELDESGHGTLVAGAENDGVHEGPGLRSDDSKGEADLSQLSPAIPGFQLKGELGRGGFGVVYRALDERLNRHVAIKIPLLDDPQRRDAYMSEARNAASVEVPGIVPVLQVGTTASQVPFVVQKLIEGSTLSKILRTGGALSAAQVIQVMVDVCNAVGTAHAQSLVHRDLKPGNIIVDLDGKPWVTDFGLAVTEEDQADRKGEIAGTPSYMSPEQLEGKVDWIDGRTDIWALGVILYQCLTGKLPFVARDRAELCDQILHRDARPICQRDPRLHRDWDAVFRKCCAKSVRDRYDTAFEMARDLAALGDDLDGQSSQTLNPILERFQHSGRESANANPAVVLPAGQRESLPPSDHESPSRGQHWAVWIGLIVALASLGIAIVAGSTFWKNRNPSLQNSAIRTQPQAPDDHRNTLRVAVDGTGDYTSIQAAIDAASDGQEIAVAAGVYTESLDIRKSTTLVGESGVPRSEITIAAAGSPAFTLRKGATLVLVGVSVSAEPVNGQPINSIDVRGGKLTISDCDVVASSYDCVRLAPGSEFTASGCRFSSSRHPAVYANSVINLDIRKCQFDLGSDESDQEPTRLVGVQVIKSGGHISKCQFVGDNARAIDWAETQDTVTIVDCDFSSLKTGVFGFKCSKLQIGAAQKSHFENCGTAIDLQDCAGRIQNCEIDGKSVAESRGIKIVGKGLSAEHEVRIESCLLKNLAKPLVASRALVRASFLEVHDSLENGVSLLHDSRLVMLGGAIRSSHATGILLESSSADLQRCQISQNLVGIVVDGVEDALTATGVDLDANEVGLIIMSGTAEIDGGEIIGNHTGIVFARKHDLLHDRTSDAPLRLTATRVSIQASYMAIQFLSPGSYRLTACKLSDPDGERPHVAAGLKESVEGDFTYVEEE